MTQSVDKQIGAVASVEPESHFVAIGREMLRANMMPRTNNASLKKREGGLNRVCMNVAININAGLVANRFMLATHKVNSGGFLVSLKFIRDKDLDVFAYIKQDILGQRAGVNVLSMEQAQFAPALSDADH